ncbi:ABC transporter permease [Demequina lignilytica]|uniref:ABC transporter permease n=1 Tax=Demequina lignilytica TaxID=3051663 RepID=A0AAW7M3U9_9MICO|nr:MULTISPECIES: ABC transporter permease [unclassified Demequina]MDN4478611.1 ABC transporter permease [Demequina sp. SYSU T00039-1]MDN4483829.1 ABC transporter permease [Demequina sp. SYSU T0a273]MDN4488589.1 ABC transporter permease [Demequina sp. SYSU T00039]
MLQTLYLKTVRDRWLGALIGVASLWLVAVFGMWAYSGIGDEAVDFFDQMPEFYSTMIGISGDAGVTGLMMSMMFNFLGPFVIAGIAISMGAAAIAGEERDGTMNVLTTAPRSRSRLFASKSAAAFTIALGVNALAWLGYVGVVLVFGETSTGVDVGAATVHVLVVSLLYGAVALAIGAATGQQQLASGVATAFLVVSFFASGLLPMIEGWEDWAKVFPWHYIGASQPLTNGVDWSQMGVIIAITAGLVVVGWGALIRRDLRSGEGRLSIVARLQDDARVAKVLELLRGRSSTRGMLGMALSDSRALLTIAGGGMFAMMVVMGPLFNAVSDVVGQFADAFPDSIMAMVGFADYSRPEGWYHGEGLSILAPVAVGVVAIAAGAALAGEERRRTISVLLTSRVSRTRVAWTRATAVLIASLGVSALTVVGMALGNWIAGLGMSYAHIFGTGVLLWGLGAVLGGVAFLGGALTGQPRIAVGAGTGVAIVGWALTAFAAVNDALEPIAHASPFYYVTWHFPLDNGMYWYQPVVLFGAAAALFAAGVAAYRERDLRG